MREQEIIMRESEITIRDYRLVFLSRRITTISGVHFVGLGPGSVSKLRLAPRT